MTSCVTLSMYAPICVAYNILTYIVMDFIHISQSQVTSAREAFEQFLQHYPFCYGYWKKFAEYEKKHSGVEEAKKVLERGLSAIPLSVDLWIHYLNFIIQYYKGCWDQSIRKSV